MSTQSVPGPRLRSDIANIPAYVPGRPPEPIDGDPWLGKLSSNENPFLPPGHVQDVIRRATDTVNRYPDGGALQLREALANRHGLDAANVALGPGSVALLYYLLMACCEPGDEVVYAWRSFEAYPLAVKLTGARPVEVPLAPGAHHDLDAMLAAITDRTRAVLVCSPNNPTGPTVDAEALARFVAAVPPEVLVVLDEAYREFVRTPIADGVGLLGRALAAGRRNVVVLRTFSKAYALAGLRVGYSFAAPEVTHAVATCAIPFGVNQFAQNAAVAALADDEAMRASTERLVGERGRVLAAIRDQGWDVPDTEANFFWMPLGDDTVEFAQTAFAEGLAIRPFAGDGARVSIGLPEANDRFLRFAEAWRRSHLG